eukprot:TRINITY_DN2788_c0_g1_i4.p1 TRINITY_DN2788_c0_g1~~TRINITY_DN2788_c0_g1_i4.p1  ORF type:complete len:183 (-),score=32.20 TRINITY_DN2788_c0_g1_i4:299-847(-)
MCISHWFFFFQRNGDHRDLHYPLRRQRQMCIRDRVSTQSTWDDKKKGMKTPQKNFGVMRAKKILQYLENIDKELYTHLKGLDIEPQIFILRWIRCLVTREFHFQDALMFWDALFLSNYFTKNENKNDGFIFADCICLAMMIFLKGNLLQRQEQTQCLQRLLKYPPVESPKLILDLAWDYFEN